MKKIISLFQRDYQGTRLVYPELVPGAEWVVAGEGVPTVKWDGTCCKIEQGVLYKRYDAKKGRTPPPGFVPAQEPDPVSNHWPGWLPVGEGPADQYHREAFQELVNFWGSPKNIPSWTYELIGPKIQGNIENLTIHTLVAHGGPILPGVPRDFEGLKAYFERNPHLEGVVWWRDPNDLESDKVKIKGKDFGVTRIQGIPLYSAFVLPPSAKERSPR